MKPGYRKLRKEIKNMLSILGGDWVLDESIVMYPTMKVASIVSSWNTAVLVSGKGLTKTEALDSLLEHWKEGQSLPYAPAAGSAEELRLKLAVAKG